MSQFLKTKRTSGNMGRKGRVLEPELIREINRLWDSGKTETTIAKTLGISVPVVNKHIGVKA